MVMAVQKIMVQTSKEVYVCHAHSYASMFMMVPNKHSTWKNTFTLLYILRENIAGVQETIVWEPDQSFKAHNWISKQKRTWYLSTQPIIALKGILQRNGIDLPSKNMNTFRSQRNEVVLISWLCMDNHLQHLRVCKISICPSLFTMSGIPPASQQHSKTI
jgi:hypothetical protein